MFADSIDKIVTSYFACVTKREFLYKNELFKPKALQVSADILRDYTCPEGCGGCCPRFSLDYLPNEPRTDRAQRRYISFNHNLVEVWSDLQDDHTSKKCRNLNMTNGRCGIYTVRPFSCDFELIRFMQFAHGPNQLHQRLFSRGWNMMRVDGARGALCEMTPPTEKSRAEVIRKLSRLNDWANHFNLVTYVPEIIDWVSKIPLDAKAPLTLGFQNAKIHFD